jgi:hypothetical protein
MATPDRLLVCIPHKRTALIERGLEILAASRELSRFLETGLISRLLHGRVFPDSKEVRRAFRGAERQVQPILEQKPNPGHDHLRPSRDRISLGGAASIFDWSIHTWVGVAGSEISHARRARTTLFSGQRSPSLACTRH